MSSFLKEEAIRKRKLYKDKKVDEKFIEEEASRKRKLYKENRDKESSKKKTALPRTKCPEQRAFFKR